MNLFSPIKGSYYGTIILLCFVSSCQLASFDRPPGQMSRPVPERLHGTYYYTEPDSMKRQKGHIDTIFYFVDVHGWLDSTTSYGRFPDDFTSFRRGHLPGLGMAFSNFEGHFFLGIGDEEDRFLGIMMIEKEMEDLAVYQIIRKDETGNDELDKYFESFRHFSKARNDSITVYKMNEKNLMKFLEKNKSQIPVTILKKYNQ